MTAPPDPAPLAGQSFTLTGQAPALDHARLLLESLGATIAPPSEPRAASPSELRPAPPSEPRAASPSELRPAPPSELRLASPDVLDDGRSYMFIAGRSDQAAVRVSAG